MSSFAISLDGPILRLKFEEPAQSPQILLDTIAALEKLTQAGQLTGGPLIAINGACPIISAYAICDYLAQKYSAIAIYDPKLNGYIVIKSATTGYQIGEVLELPEQHHPHPLKIVLCGPPNVGKSCLREGLKQALMHLYRQGKSPYPYVLTACPDGEGAWFSETALKNEALAKQLKAQYRARFTPEFAEQTAKAVTNLRLPITLIDIGGRITNDNRQIVGDATHAIILWREKLPKPEADPWYTSQDEWLQFCDQMQLEQIAIIESQRAATTDHITAQSPQLRGHLHGLERGRDCHQQPMVQALAHDIAHRSLTLGRSTHA